MVACAPTHTPPENARLGNASPAPGAPGAGVIQTRGRGRVLALARAGGTAPEWVELIPPGGTVTTRDNRGPYKLVDPAAIVADFAALYPPGSDQAAPIDYDHADLHRETGEDLTPAAGWITELRVSEGGGIEGRVEWTERAAGMVAAREVRYISPELLIDPDTREVVGISGAGLTHRPNLYLRALSHASRPTLEPQMDDHLATQLRYMLNLPTTSTPEEIAEHLSRLVERLRGTTEAMGAVGLLPEGQSAPAAVEALHQLRAGLDDLSADLALEANAAPVRVLQSAREELASAAREAEVQRAAWGALREAVSLPDGQSGTPAEVANAAATRIRELESAAAERDAREQVAEAMRGRLIPPAQREWAEEYARRDPQGFRRYLSGCQAVVPSAPVTAQPQAAADVDEFSALVSAHMREHGVTRGRAMMAVAKAHPEAHRAWVEQTQQQRDAYRA